MIAEGHGGAIVMVSSISAHVGAPTQVAYCGTKGAISMLGKALGSVLGGHKIRVNVVEPGAVATNMSAAMFDMPDVVKYYLERIALHRIADPRNWPRQSPSCFRTMPVTLLRRRCLWMPGSLSMPSCEGKSVYFGSLPIASSAECGQVSARTKGIAVHQDIERSARQLTGPPILVTMRPARIIVHLGQWTCTGGLNRRLEARQQKAGSAPFTCQAPPRPSAFRADRRWRARSLLLSCPGSSGTRRRLCSSSRGLCLFGSPRLEPRRRARPAAGSRGSDLRGDPAR